MARDMTIREALRAARPETVTIRLPVEKSKPKCLLVSVNGVRYSIERGKAVDVPWAVAEVIEQSVRSDEAVRERIERLVANPSMAVI